ncbi:YqjF family protein [Catalinimonas niigatensis]|uniref:YqjF family protein n=1 Tax=Catalinimonas niigatensis TaxID=1397264 RepID=UPI0026656066|nr:DUF2071 domain-containing protein [Catalinimonas niigatensis]WPP49742.1 DUF2071 domain-containing protein [Catalinimonas niigatensis]
MNFLTAEWRKLVLANYAIDQEVLKKYIPHQTELDIWEDTCYISLVGFMFQDTRLLGVKVPLHTTFEEVNLRFYVRYKEDKQWKRGVVFIKELVPKTALTWVANTLYKEHYQTVPMNHHWLDKGDTLEVEYSWMYNKTPQFLKVIANNTLTDIAMDSEMEFITEHYWGYTRISKNKTFEYEVTHPRWQAYPVIGYKIDVDFGLVYGQDFGFINRLTPQSVMLAEGSKISVRNKKEI